MKRNRSDSLTVTNEMPLDVLKIDVNKNGKTIEVPALYKGFAKNCTFLLFEAPPVAESPDDKEGQLLLDTRLEMWLEAAAFFRDDMRFLLGLPHHRFWSQVVFHVGLHASLESFLSQAPRAHDMTYAPYLGQSEKGSQRAQVAAILGELHRLVFLVYHRMATYKESKSCHITPTVFGKLLYRYFLYDIPKMMDLCSLYGDANKLVLSKMINNIFTNQPKYYDDLGITVPVILQALFNVEARLFLRAPSEAMAETATLQSRQGEKCLADIKWSDLLDVMLYVLDVAVTIHHFLDVFPLGCQAFHLAGFPIRVAAFYELVIPNFVKEIHRRSKHPEVETVLDEVKKRLSLARSCLLKAFRQVVAVCCIHPILENSGSTQVYQNIDDLLQIMTSVLPERSFVADYHPRWAFSDDVEIMQQTGITVDSSRFEYILEGFNTIVAERNTGLATQILDMTKNVPSKSKKSRSKEQSASSNGVTSSNAHSSGGYGAESGGACAGPALSGVELESLVTQVKDLFSDLGHGFVEACLEYYNYNCESVINALLENTLPQEIDKLDRQLASRPRQPEAPQAAPVATMLSERRNVFDGDEFDVFQRDDVDKSRIQRGKRRTTEAGQSGRPVDEELKALTLNLSDKLELEGRSRPPVSRPAVGLLDEYDDEYDDTYDEQMVGDTGGGSTLDELLERRPFGVPRVLATREESEEEEEMEENPNHNWNNNNGQSGRPRDQFVEDPAVVRERAAQRWQDKRGGGVPYNNRNVRGRPRGQGQEETVVRSRANKEKNKSSSANHSRRFMGDRKRSSGMYPS